VGRFAGLLHGDLHTANILVHEGVLAAVIDFGDITCGDPASDLAAAWMLFEPDARERFRLAAGAIDAATWARAQGWALSLALVLLAGSSYEPVLHSIGERTLAAVLADPRAA
jgi:aminoglycoside phosphotransferase (APT) family kinase protein